jgi:hypothetical protein
VHEVFPPPKGAHAPEFIAMPSDTGDDCHGNVYHVSDDRLKKILRRAELVNKMHLCVDGKIEPYTHERAVELVKHHFDVD